MYLYMYVCVFLCICMYLYLFVCIFLYFYVFLCICVFLFVHCWANSDKFRQFRQVWAQLGTTWAFHTKLNHKTISIEPWKLYVPLLVLSKHSTKHTSRKKRMINRASQETYKMKFSEMSLPGVEIGPVPVLK